MRKERDALEMFDSIARGIVNILLSECIQIKEGHSSTNQDTDLLQNFQSFSLIPFTLCPSTSYELSYCISFLLPLFIFLLATSIYENFSQTTHVTPLRNRFFLMFI